MSTTSKNPLISLKVFVYLANQLSLIDSAYNLVNRLSSLKKNERRNGHDPIFTCHLLGLVHIYFDDLRAVTDLFAEDSRDVDDIMDVW